jgi:branched-chain amino acid transport system ATP-binding protein
LARAAAAEPTLLLLDEPSSGLSTDEVTQFEALLMHLREAGTSVVLVEHNMRLVMRAATHVVVLDQGKKLAEGPPKVVKKDPAVQSAYLGAAADA